MATKVSLDAEGASTSCEDAEGASTSSMDAEGASTDSEDAPGASKDFFDLQFSQLNKLFDSFLYLLCTIG